jgi:hypothetical protein
MGKVPESVAMNLAAASGPQVALEYGFLQPCEDVENSRPTVALPGAHGEW